MSPNPFCEIDTCVLPETHPNSNHFRVNLVIRGRNRSTTAAAMIDSGATSTFIHQQFIERNGIITHALFKPIELRNVDGSPNKAGSLTE